MDNSASTSDGPDLEAASASASAGVTTKPTDASHGNGNNWNDGDGGKKEKDLGKKEAPPMVTMRQLFSFGSKNRRKKNCCLVLGSFCAVLSGLIFPTMVFFISGIFQALGASSEDPDFMANVRSIVFIMMILGAVSLVLMLLQTALLETAARDMANSMKTQWFAALLRQDMAYHDLMDVSGTASIIASSANKYQMGIGWKMGEGIQFTVTMLGGLAYAFYSSWQVSLVLLAAFPLMLLPLKALMRLNQKKAARVEEDYAETGGIVYSVASSIKTVLGLNASPIMAEKFEGATDRAYRASTRTSKLVLEGLCNGGLMGTFLICYIAVTLYGSYLLYSSVRSTGCDPSGSVPTNATCDITGREIFSAMMGIYFGAQGIPQVGAALEAITNARVACHPAMCVINRTVGGGTDSSSSQQVVSKPAARNKRGQRNSVVLPTYVIDSSTTDGLKPPSIHGTLEFRSVTFRYPARPDTKVFDDFCLTIPGGKTLGIVGASGSGKSTVTSLVERFYDPSSGSVHLDGTNLTSINVAYLRERIGLVSQEPTLFATTIGDNIRNGMPDATQEMIEEAARKANAYDFIMSFPDGFETQVGDKGAQLSGGQKQRVAIARVILRNPKILILDEATSALDSESELVVQKALDGLLQSGGRTTIVIAHRLSTIRNADIIAVLADGRVVEQGTHEALMELDAGHYRRLVEAQSRPSVAPGTSVDELAKHVHKFDPPASRRSTRGSMASTLDVVDEQRQQQQGVEGHTSAMIEFQNVHFTYPSRPNNPIFRGLNLTVYEGETLAIVGPSGHGKSSIVSLIERFYDVTSGSVRLYGEDVRDLNVRWLRDQIGLVGQEPTLFDTSILENIRYGMPDATQDMIEAAARKANAWDFVMKFPEGFSTQVGSRGVQVSGGQKQRISIARAIVKQPRLLIFDEATSALDSESETAVQEALSNMMASKAQTTIVIAHRLSTIQNADRIAVVADGRVVEQGDYKSLINKPNGRFKRLSMLQSLAGEDHNKAIEEIRRMAELEDDDDDVAEQGAQQEETTMDALKDPETELENTKRARLLAKGDISSILVGCVGAFFTGLVFPSWGVLFAFMIRLFFNAVLPCDGSSCGSYYDTIAYDMREMSFKITYGWLGTLGATLLGNALLFYGFSKSSESMNRRVRNAAFGSLIKQECAYFDARTTGSITNLIQEDAALLHAFSGEPIRVLVMNLSSVVVGLIVSFVCMWPLATLVLCILPFMAFASSMKVKRYEEVGVQSIDDSEEESSPGGIIIESLLNIRTVASLTMEDDRYNAYVNALHDEEKAEFRRIVMQGFSFGMGQFTQFYGMSLMFWFGGWLLSTYPASFTYERFLVSMFSLMFSIRCIGYAFQGITDRDKAKDAARRVFDLIDRKSAIDPMSDEGKKLVS